VLAVGKAGTACHVERIVRAGGPVDRIAEAREPRTAERPRSYVYEDEDGMVVIGAG